MNTAYSYESVLIDIMRGGNTLSEALDLDMWNNGIDRQSVYDVTDYLETRLKNLDKVGYYMGIYTGLHPDIMLKKV